MAMANNTLAGVIANEVRKAQRAGMPLENCLATLINVVEQLQQVLPFVQAAQDYERGSPCD